MPRRGAWSWQEGRGQESHQANFVDHEKSWHRGFARPSYMFTGSLWLGGQEDWTEASMEAGCPIRKLCVSGLGGYCDRCKGVNYRCALQSSTEFTGGLN